MVDWITGVVKAMGYPGVAMLMFVENVFPPIPSELIMPFAGMVATRGEMSFWWVIVAGTIGSVLGALPLYYLGYAVGEERLKRWADKHGCWVALSSDDIEKARSWFERHGGAVVFFGRLIPGIRSIVSIPAGTDRMNLPLFLFYTTLGAGLWTALLAYLGRILGHNYHLVEQYLGPAAWIVLGAVAAAFVIRVIRHYAGSRSRRPGRSETPQRHG